VKRWIGAFLALQALDAVLTAYGLSAAGATEKNPVAAAYFAAVGIFPGILSIKVVGVALLIYLGWKARNSKHLPATIKGLTAMMVVVCLRNFYVVA
jgi:3-hydroxymyristoyl/3-hydroxydecanoyl-(acyl carrier protein) dehydratase